jgi:4-amino-4-deoxy-L-arabinose transferase-like glycosyltransferase
LFFGVVLAWLIPAGLTEGFGQATTMLVPAASGWSAGELLSPIVALLMRYLPFSLFLLVALVRQLRHSTADADERSFERFLATWLLGGLLVVSLTGQKGADPVFVLWPAGALLAGREMARLAERMGKTKFAGVAVVISCILIGATYNAVHSVGPGNLGSLGVLGRELQLARNAELAASAMQAQRYRSEHFAPLGNAGNAPVLPWHLPSRSSTRRHSMSCWPARPGRLISRRDGAGIESLGVADRFPGTRRIFRWPDDESQAAGRFRSTASLVRPAGGRLASSH